MVTSDLYTYARLCNDAYAKGHSAASPQAVDVSIHQNFKAKVYRLGGATVIAYAGTNDLRDAVVEDVLAIGLTGDSDFMHFDRAVSLARAYQTLGRVEVCGHSLGGGYAQLVARQLRLNAITFNAPGVAHMTTATMPLGIINPVNLVLGAGRNVYDAVVSHHTIYNFRHPLDPVSRLGIHCGRICKTLSAPKLPITKDIVLKAHSIVTIESWLKDQAGKRPEAF